MHHHFANILRRGACIAAGANMHRTLDLVRGLGLANTITDDRRRREAILDRWALTLDATLTGRTP